MIVPRRLARPRRAGQAAGRPRLEAFELQDIALQLLDERLILPQSGLRLGEAGLEGGARGRARRSGRAGYYHWVQIGLRLGSDCIKIGFRLY